MTLLFAAANTTSKAAHSSHLRLQIGKKCCIVTSERLWGVCAGIERAGRDFSEALRPQLPLCITLPSEHHSLSAQRIRKLQLKIYPLIWCLCSLALRTRGQGMQRYRCRRFSAIPTFESGPLAVERTKEVLSPSVHPCFLRLYITPHPL